MILVPSLCGLEGNVYGHILIVVVVIRFRFGLLSKVLSIRLIKVLDLLMAQNQNAFIKESLIFESFFNHILLQES